MITKSIFREVNLASRPSSRPSNTASGGTSTHGTTRLTPITCQPDGNKLQYSGSGQAHNRLNYHLYSKLRIGHTEQCPCGTGRSDNRTSTAVLPHLRATQKGNLVRPHSRSPQAVRKPEGLAMHCHLHRGDWNFHLTNEKKKKKNLASKTRHF